MVVISETCKTKFRREYFLGFLKNFNFCVYFYLTRIHSSWNIETTQLDFAMMTRKYVATAEVLLSFFQWLQLNYSSVMYYYIHIYG